MWRLDFPGMAQSSKLNLCRRCNFLALGRVESKLFPVCEEQSTLTMAIQRAALLHVGIETTSQGEPLSQDLILVTVQGGSLSWLSHELHIRGHCSSSL